MSNIYCRIKGEKYKVSFKENLNSVFFTSMIDKNKSYNFPFTMKVSDAVKVIKSSK